MMDESDLLKKSRKLLEDDKKDERSTRRHGIVVLPLWLLISLVVIPTVMVASGLIIYTFAVQKIELWEGQVQDTDFSVTRFDIKIQGKNRVGVFLELTNIDAATHSANVTLQLLDSLGNVIVEDYALTGDVAGAGTWSHNFAFMQNGLVEQYTSHFMVIDQIS